MKFRTPMFAIAGAVIIFGTGISFLFSLHVTGDSQTVPSPAKTGSEDINDTAMEYSVVLTESGYKPQTLDVNLGDKVTFSTTRDKPHWPASNLHPTHTIYREFDPMKPVAPEDSWTFQFNKTGTWEFHDHIRSYFRGTITVHGES